MVALVVTVERDLGTTISTGYPKLQIKLNILLYCEYLNFK